MQIMVTYFSHFLVFWGLGWGFLCTSWIFTDSPLKNKWATTYQLKFHNYTALEVTFMSVLCPHLEQKFVVLNRYFNFKKYQWRKITKVKYQRCLKMWISVTPLQHYSVMLRCSYKYYGGHGIWGHVAFRVGDHIWEVCLTNIYFL